MALLPIRTFGDPVLKQPTPEVETVDESIVRLVEDMIETMHAAPGVGLAAPQVGVQKRLFVFDVGDGPHVVLNPQLSGHRDEWTYDEGCLSVPSLFWPIVRPKHVHLRGRDLEGREISIEADELLARVFQHETDHLDGTLILERLDPEQRKQALRTLRERTLSLDAGDQR
ncbi:MAG TPA: peptide deformylase [Acidimicrobiales bacterium]|nr:peptide deformylase [Acidimicrobiales bacterium]